VELVSIAPPAFSCVVAAERSRGIGLGDDLPWPRLPGDLAHFKRVTQTTRAPDQRNAVIMGRKTWDSVPVRVRPLPGRLNIVISRGPLDVPTGAVATTSLDAAIDAAVAAGVESIHVVGGAQIYLLALADPRCAVVYHPRIDADFPCDAFLPPLDGFTLDAIDPPQADSGVPYQIERWVRR